MSMILNETTDAQHGFHWSWIVIVITTDLISVVTEFLRGCRKSFNIFLAMKGLIFFSDYLEFAHIHRAFVQSYWHILVFFNIKLLTFII